MISKLRHRRKNRLALIAASLALTPAVAAWAGVDSQITAGIVLPDRTTDRVGDRTPDRSLADIVTLKSGLDALSQGRAAVARKIRDSFPRTSLEHRILAWAIAMRGGYDVPSADIASASAMLTNWPGAKTLRRNSERAIFREKPEPKEAIAAFKGSTPETLEGVLLLARSHAALGEVSETRAALSAFWRNEKLEPQEEQRIIKEFGAIIPAADYRARMERMLYAERINSADRIAKLAEAEELAKAWTAVIRGAKNAPALLKAVPVAQRGAGYAYAEAKLLRRNKKFSEAAEVMLKAPTDPASVIDADAWWLERRVLSRELADRGDMKTAYKIAAAHAAESPVNLADAEFHAGWYAFRGLNDAKAGARHFARIAEVADGAISLARGYYWLGRAAEAGAPGDPKAYYRKAAVYGTTFYGQLAAEHIGSAALNVDYPAPSGGDKNIFERREAIHAIRRLQQCGYNLHADILYKELAAKIINAREIALLAAMAEKRGSHDLALKIGKIATARGIDAGAVSHPVGAIPASADISDAGEALAYAIARQESEFNVGAVSHAGARGLLQLLPTTAKEVAKKAGLTYSKDRLTTDAGYNATLGSVFLGEQLGRFDGSYVLTFAGYNAGPGRAREWIKRYGDPRGKDVNAVVDWIEKIPFAETRAYVQRVMENYQVYKMRLSGTFDIEGDLVKGR